MPARIALKMYNLNGILISKERLWQFMERSNGIFFHCGLSEDEICQTIINNLQYKNTVIPFLEPRKIPC